MIDSHNQTDPTHFLGRLVQVQIDRPLGSHHPEHGFVYPVNYGFIPGTLAADGEELDAYLLAVAEPLTSFYGRCQAIIHRLNDDDDKLVVTPDGLSLTDDEIIRQTHFQEQYFHSVIWRRSTR
jgi:inorganic pyrophosphatase